MATSGHESLFIKVMPDDTFSRKVMEERAALLATEVVDTVSIEENTINYIRFKLGNELYGIAYHDVSEVMSVAFITPIPMAPKFVLGVVYWHGKLIPVIDLASHFHISASQHNTNLSLIAIAKHEKSIIGFKFDDVTGVDAYLHESLDKNLAMNTKIKEQYVNGIHHGRVTILNMNQIVIDLTAELLKKKGEQS